MLNASYRRDLHRNHVDRHKSTDVFDRSSFTRCRILDSSGQWNGIDPSLREDKLHIGQMDGDFSEVTRGFDERPALARSRSDQSVVIMHATQVVLVDRAANIPASGAGEV